MHLTELQEFYQRYDEAGRLDSPRGRLEFARTKELLQRHLPNAPADILDVGGGPGRYSCWLAEHGYDVDLVDPVMELLDQAREASRALANRPIRSISIGDARSLEFEDNSFDGVLLLGPLYHLVERSDRVAALREALRVLRPDGVAFAVAISRYASLGDGFRAAFFDDEQFATIVERDLATGVHRDTSEAQNYFTTSYFHHPDELASEVSAAGLTLRAVVGIEGPGWTSPNLHKMMDDEKMKETFLRMTRSIEAEPSLIGASAHIMAVAVKTAQQAEALKP